VSLKNTLYFSSPNLGFAVLFALDIHTWRFGGWQLGFPKRVLRTRFHRVVFNEWGTSRPCLFPPMAAKSKPPAVRVVVDSGTL
jgi:hypothetical protein